VGVTFLLGQTGTAGTYRSINTDVYEVGIQKNGTVNVTLVSGAPVFAGAFPMVWIEDDEAPKPLSIRGQDTVRQAVHTPLGEGQGMMFAQENCVWLVQAYPTKPYLAAEVTFVNRTKKSVRVKALYPWCIGTPKKGLLSLGPATSDALVLEQGRTLCDPLEIPSISRGAGESLWNMAIVNPTSGRSLVAGFVTSALAFTRITVGQAEKMPPETLGLFRAGCEYDPPVEVHPGGKLTSELLYLSVSESDPHVGLKRFAAAVARANPSDTRIPFIPRGWDSWSSGYGTDISEESLLETLEFIDTHLKRYGWTHFTVGAGWEKTPGLWEPDSVRFPHGMKSLADEIHARGMTAGLAIDPFLVDKTSAVAQAHPEWVCAVDEAKRSVTPPSCGILDPTDPGVITHLKALCQQVRHEWGYDALVSPNLVRPLLEAAEFSDATATRAAAVRLGVQTLRDCAAPNGCVLGGGADLITGTMVKNLSLGGPTVPVWRAGEGVTGWGCVEAFTNAARRYYLTPNLWVADMGCAYVGTPETRSRWHLGDGEGLTERQQLAWLTGAALMGGALRVGDNPRDLSATEIGWLTKLLPTPTGPARPIDLFESPTPRVWSLPLATSAGKWYIVAAFNWDDHVDQEVPVRFRTVGLRKDAYYTVYDFWEDRYYGTAREHLSVKVAPGGVRLLGLRDYVDHPMFLATDRHITQGASDHREITWTEGENRLRGVFEGVGDTDYRLRILVPPAYGVVEASTSAGTLQRSQEERVLTLAFHCFEPGDVEWWVRFNKSTP